GSEQSAWFYMPFTLIVAFDLLFYNVTTSMTVEGAHDEHRAPELARTVVRRFLSIQIPAALAVIVAAPVLLYPFGADYVDHGTGALRVLACASIPRAVVNLFVALARLRGRGWFIVGGQATLFLLVTVLALALARPLGLPGVALAWLVGNTVVAASAMPWLVRLLREGR
ncbi:MAG: sle, partial [Solirubrobacterales bacterium]|nr:sle [Solirubrobacterales bacterium]